MKWFKHLSHARNDERIAHLEDIAGLEGYGFYFKLLEIVAEAMDGTDKCDAEFSVQRWASLTNCHPIKASTLLGKVASCGLVERRLRGDRVVVSIPNLLKHRDNHTKNLQVASKQEKEKEKEQEKEKTISSEQQEAVAPEPAVAHLPLVDGTEFAITAGDIVGWRQAYPAVDVQAHLLRMREWCLSNPTKRKTRRGIRNFVTAWLAKQQDKGGSAAPAVPQLPRWK